MNNFIHWLFQTTSDGATHAQVIVILLLICYLAYVAIDSVKKIKRSI